MYNDTLVYASVKIRPQTIYYIYLTFTIVYYLSLQGDMDHELYKPVNPSFKDCQCQVWLYRIFQYKNKKY